MQLTHLHSFKLQPNFEDDPLPAANKIQGLSMAI